jgi:hypothetical protein
MSFHHRGRHQRFGRDLFHDEAAAKERSRVTNEEDDEEDDETKRQRLQRDHHGTTAAAASAVTVTHVPPSTILIAAGGGGLTTTPSLRNNPHDGDGSSSSSSSSSSDDSVLSENEYDRDEWKQCGDGDRGIREMHRPGGPPRPPTRSLQEQWDDLERHFAFRARILNRIVKKGKLKHPAFVRQLRERSFLVRVQAVERLLFRTNQRSGLRGNHSPHADEATRTVIADRLRQERESFWKDHDEEEDALRRSTGFFAHGLYNILVFEMHASIPAVVVLVVHCLAHNGLYDGLNAIIEATRKYLVHPTEEGARIDLILYGTLFVLGAFLLRITGDLYWWLSDEDYDIVKFDYHNRLRLRYRDARAVWSIRKRNLLRVTLYMVGYYLSYVSSAVLFHHIKNLFDERQSIVEHLPSVVFQQSHGLCLAQREESFCDHSCQVEIIRQGMFLGAEPMPM